MNLIDDLIKDNVQSEFDVKINNTTMKGWQIAKPLNYSKKYTSFLKRLKSAFLVLKGKAIAVQFFTDLTFEEQCNYVKQKIKYD